MSEKIKSLQMLRAIAAWMVVYHHFMQLFFGLDVDGFSLGALFVRYGGFGVDLFFVLSGFVMFSAVNKGHVSACRFAVGRVFRIVPAYWFHTLLVVAGISLFPQGFSYTDYNLGSLLKSLFFIPVSNPSGLGVYPLLTVGWTLDFEMFFYMALAVCLLISQRWGLLLCFVLLGSLPFVFPGGYAFSPVLSSKLLYEFLIGFVLALLTGNRGFAEWSQRYAYSLGGFLLIVGLLCMAIHQWAFIYRFTAAGSLVLAALVLESRINPQAILVKALVRLGDASYSTYLVHIIVICVALQLFGKAPAGLLMVFILALVTMLVCVLSLWSYRYVESNSWVMRLQKLFMARISRPKGVLHVSIE
ncbi:MAG: acyltransferase [Zoogloea sp.]|nr:acyltransferase [Zoogloea sp.]